MSNTFASPKPPVQIRITRLVAIGLGVIALLSAGLYVGAVHVGDTLRLAGATDDTMPIELKIGEHRLDIPANEIRFPEQRTAQPQREVDLYLRWPGMTGFAESAKEEFHDPEAANLLFLRLSAAQPKSDEEDAPGRAATAGPLGLERSSRAGLPGLSSEEAVYRAAPDRTPAYETSCLDGKDVVMAADCIRDIQIAPGLRLRYRFSHALLPQWDRMDRTVLAYIAARRRS